MMFLKSSVFVEGNVPNPKSALGQEKDVGDCASGHLLADGHEVIHHCQIVWKSHWLVHCWSNLWHFFVHEEGGVGLANKSWRRKDLGKFEIIKSAIDPWMIVVEQVWLGISIALHLSRFSWSILISIDQLGGSHAGCKWGCSVAGDWVHPDKGTIRWTSLVPGG